MGFLMSLRGLIFTICGRARGPRMSTKILKGAQARRPCRSSKPTKFEFVINLKTRERRSASRSHRRSSCKADQVIE